jgi:5-formyltetrahydrofolate cyclo-ligase
MQKKEARKFYRNKRQALAATERMKLDDLILIQFQALHVPFIHTVLAYHPIEENNEPETAACLGYLEFKNPAIKIAYPKTNFLTLQMEAVEVDPDTAFQKNPQNIIEPVNGIVIAPGVIDLVLVPLLACDRQGYRVGYGKGFYDKYLSQCRPDCIRLGLSYFEPMDKITDRDEFDVPLSACVTPYNSYVF